jgi:hypothetical protein
MFNPPAGRGKVLILSALAVCTLIITAVAQQPEPPGAEVSEAVRHDRLARLGDITPVEPPVGGPARRKPLGELPEVPGTTGNPDPVVQTDATAPALNTAAGFDGIGISNYSVDAAPPDTNGAAGPNHYVQWVNEAFAVFDKTSGAIVYGPAAGNTLWQGFGGPCETFNDGDPVVLYDHLAGRWIFSQFAISQGSPYLQCVAVSQTSDPTGGYNRYAFSYTLLNDYPKIGIWPDAYYVTQNMFQRRGNGWNFKGANVCAYDRNRMLQGLSATQQCFLTSSSYGGLLPSDIDGAVLPPAGAPNYILNFGANKLNLWKFHVDWSTPANSTLTGPTAIPVASFSTACNGGGACVPQLGTAQSLDSLGDRLMYRLAYRNFGDHEALVVNHSVAAGSGVGVRWYEIRSPGSSPSVYQQGTFAPDSTYRWMGSIAMDQSGDIALGYSVSGTTIKPGIRYTGRAPTDPLNTLQSETLALDGTGSQLVNLNRWGDYSSMSLDPADDCTFWYTNEFLISDGTFNWSTRIISFKFPSCGTISAPAAPTNLAAVPGNAQVSLSWTASSGATSYTVLRSTTSGSGYTTIASGVATTSYLDTSVINGTTYFYVVRAVNGSGTSPNSNEAGATPACSAPAVPSGLAATPGNGQVTLNWTASFGATNYNVKRSTTSGGPYTTIAPGISTTNYVDTNVVNGTTYYYVVSAINSCLESNNSSQVSAIPAAGGLNVALAANGGVASASSTFNSSYAPSGAINGDRKGANWGAGGGWNDATSNTFPDWLEVDFNGSKTINEVDVFTVQDNYAAPSDPTSTMTFTLYGLTDFQVQYWTGTQWVIVPGGVVSGNNLVWRKVTFGALTTTAIRVSVTGALGDFSRVAEVEAYTAAANGVSVALTAPSQGATFTAPATVPVTASASSSNGIAKVDFFANGIPIGTDTTNPFGISWSNVAAGSYTLLAVATDGAGAATTSAPVGITVNPASGIVNVALAANGGVATASSTYSGSYAPGGAINGDRKGANWSAGGGWNDATSNTFPDWLEVDFNGSKTINEVDVFTLQDNYAAPSDPTSTMTFTLYGLTDFQVQYWTGTLWVTVPGGTVSGNNQVWRKLTFGALTTTAIRVSVTGALADFSRIAEVEAYTAP